MGTRIEKQKVSLTVVLRVGLCVSALFGISNFLMMRESSIGRNQVDIHETMELIENLKGQLRNLEGENDKLKKEKTKMIRTDKALHRKMNDQQTKLNTQDTMEVPMIQNLQKEKFKIRKEVVAASKNKTATITDDDAAQNNMTDSKKKRVFSHFLSHIPKAAGVYAFDMITQMVHASPQWLALPTKDKFSACNMYLHPTEKFEEYKDMKIAGVRCNLWMSERGYTSQAEHIYTVVRDPKEHVLSMYFYCKESKENAHINHRIPALDDWLEAWVDVLRNKTTVAKNTRKFGTSCYNPIDFESNYLEFDQAEGKEDLKKRYDVIGDQAHLQKSICVIVTRYTGWVPQECDCTNTSIDMNSTTTTSIEMNTTTTSTMARRRLLEHGDGDSSASSTSRRRLGLDYDASKHGHGVTHHGGTFKTTRRQDEAIAKLREKDFLLYPLVKEIFEEQVKEVEQEYQVKLCDKKLRMREDWKYSTVPYKFVQQMGRET